MSENTIVRPGRNYARQDMEDAATDARTVVSQSKVLQTAVAVMVLSRRLYTCAREVLDTELTQGWDIQNPGLVIQTLTLAAQEKAVEPFSLVVLQQELVKIGVSFVDILISANKERKKQQDKVLEKLAEEEVAPEKLTKEDAEALILLLDDDKGLVTKIREIKQRLAAESETSSDSEVRGRPPVHRDGDQSAAGLETVLQRAPSGQGCGEGGDQAAAGGEEEGGAG